MAGVCPRTMASRDAHTCTAVLVQDEDRAKQGLNEVPSPGDMNAMLARSPEELQLFERMDAEMPWIPPSSGRLQPPHCRRLEAHPMCVPCS